VPTASAKRTSTAKSPKTITAKTSATKTKSSEKPVSRERFGIERLLAGHPAMRKLRDEGHIPSIHGTKHWPSADLLIDYLQENPLKKKAGVIDAGCGWGLGGIYCAKNFKSKVTAVDADDAVFPFLQAHAKLNGVKIETLKKKFQNVKKDTLEDMHAVIGADICFWDELVKPLLKLIDRSLDSGVKRVMIADPQRSPFFDLATKCIKRYDADLVEWRSKAYPRISGSILVIDKR
jgi:predicted nicotinamide N-methyase